MKIKDSITLKDKKILLAVTGSIAAVKTPLLVSNLIKKGAKVRCVVTPSASKLVSPLSLATLSRNNCYQDKNQWDGSEPKPLHIALSEWADIVVVAPLSASSLSRWVNGLGDGLIASLLLACEKPVIAAAAMNTGMWCNEGVKHNWDKLNKYKNVITLSPSNGLLACDRIGEGRMANPEIIQLAIESAFLRIKSDKLINRDWEGLKLLISAGPTIEDLDPARYLSNRSTGLTGILLGQVARFRGASVDIVHGPLQVPENFSEGLNTYPIRSGKDMQKMLSKLQANSNAIAMTAAISDLRLKNCSNQKKLNKESLIENLCGNFELVPDLLAELGKNRPNGQIILGFSALTGTDNEIKQLAILKKSRKGCDLVFANPIDRPDQGFESNLNEGWLVGAQDSLITIPIDSKLSIAHLLLDEVLKLIKKQL
ncbi:MULTISPECIES: bifunctional phosphopantothenoylcysteine decarboxylase/phosphopantothenate--cysteine ligase CoaBC [Prochlorococcus]|uniref:bifunctional phosphopantothenoylcysteine decarboxylase/phosphopantothenate--cysteine ligase CoaBC n=1 Tax=Prochlorococcus TaxID=1218 RepID=UPI000533AE4C|nr:MULTISPECIES: bifunctional phosphopantothenoylcysteine decarboxylase/phosphopantothenate--cysteine ligase CoaBC [Prochlorococcus]KGG13137.1 Phosphopantothenoylcysteine decarboxylase [Prochlorococcus sp. MIT 0601]